MSDVIRSPYALPAEELARLRLIAAAADLLEALLVVSDASDYMDFDPDSRFGDAMKVVRAAIAKATTP